uniref:Uncharacterized protein n=1 Tax=Vespula pensylvanica TaxID=30213 RepID=A0A834P7U2_VESPE|nr:hypothetical protein H0235_004720 [Vespula pensylvanica]
MSFVTDNRSPAISHPDKSRRASTVRVEEEKEGSELKDTGTKNGRAKKTRSLGDNPCDAADAATSTVAIASLPSRIFNPTPPSVDYQSPGKHFRPRRGCRCKGLHPYLPDGGCLPLVLQIVIITTNTIIINIIVSVHLIGKVGGTRSALASALHILLALIIKAMELYSSGRKKGRESIAGWLLVALPLLASAIALGHVLTGLVSVKPVPGTNGIAQETA